MPILTGASDAQIDEARLRLARVGIEEVRGYLAGGVKAWREAGFPVMKTAQISAQELNQMLGNRSLLAEHVIDVRREGEWQAGHIPGVRCTPLDTFAHGVPEMATGGPVAVHCKSGYRSIIACSLLERAGRGNVMNVAGGFDAWHNAALPEIAELVSL
jgi:hydroxyacylglutathione hydrolase